MLKHLVVYLFGFITAHYEQFSALAKSNPVVGGMIGLWGLGVLTFLLRNVPLSIYGFFKQQLTTSVVINSQDDIYYLMLKYIAKTKLHGFMRNYNISGMTNTGSGVRNSMFTMGYGSNFIFFKGRPIFLFRYKVEGNATAGAKEVMEVSVFGRSTKLLTALFAEIQKFDQADPNIFKIYQFIQDYWRNISDAQTRSMETLAFPKRILDKLTTHIDDYIANKEWFIKHGIMYKTGILLQGPPGTGKTSMVTAICSKYKKNCYVIDLNKMTDDALKNAIAQVPQGQIILMEDIDAYFSNRENGKAVVSEMKEIMGCSLIGILNALDGIACGVDRIVFATTNHPENLDPALIREGRFDLKLTIDYMEDEVFKQYFHRFYPSFLFTELNNWVFKEHIPPCKVQQLIFENRHDPMIVLHAIADRITTNVEVSK